MSKKSSILIWVILGLLAVSATGVYFYLKRQNQLAQRHHLLCEVLKPGMSKDDVLTILRKAGTFVVGDTDSPSRLVVLLITFTDPKGRDIYGAFNLLFIDDKYERAYVRHGSDNWEVICDFYNPPTKSITETSIPSP